MIACLKELRAYSLIKEIQVYIRAPYSVFLFVKMENNKIIKEIKHDLCNFIDKRNKLFFRLCFLLFYFLNPQTQVEF